MADAVALAEVVVADEDLVKWACSSPSSPLWPRGSIKFSWLSAQCHHHGVSMFLVCAWRSTWLPCFIRADWVSL